MKTTYAGNARSRLSALDPLSILLAAFILVIVAAVAGYVPTWRVACVNPMTALRYE